MGCIFRSARTCGAWMEGWMDGWMDGWREFSELSCWPQLPENVWLLLRCYYWGGTNTQCVCVCVCFFFFFFYYRKLHQWETLPLKKKRHGWRDSGLMQQTYSVHSLHLAQSHRGVLLSIKPPHLHLLFVFNSPPFKKKRENKPILVSSLERVLLLSLWQIDSPAPWAALCSLSDSLMSISWGWHSLSAWQRLNANVMPPNLTMHWDLNSTSIQTLFLPFCLFPPPCMHLLSSELCCAVLLFVGCAQAIKCQRRRWHVFVHMAAFPEGEKNL